MLTHWLYDTEQFANPDSLATFQKHLPFDWIKQALADTNKASMRRRKLPAELVVWLVIGMGLYRDRSITEVVTKLDLQLSDKQGVSVVPSAIPQARQRLSQDPLEKLFHMTAKTWSKQADSDDLWHGLSLFSVDGTVFRCADTPELVNEFGYTKHHKTTHSEYPILRLCALMSLRSRLIVDVNFGASRQGEVTLTKSLIRSVTPNSLTLFDRCYLSAELLLNWQRGQDNAHWLTPIKRNTKYEVIEKYNDQDFLVEMNVSVQARKKDPTLPEKWQARLVTLPNTNSENHITGVLTSLIDVDNYSTSDLQKIYFERWEIENGYGEIKSQLLDNQITLRSQKTDGIYQEVWGILMAYNLIRVEISEIAKEAKVSPLRISFVMAMRYIQDEFMWCAIAAPGSIPKKLRALRENVKQFILPEKRKRPKDRTVRYSKTRYPVISKHS